MNKIIQKRKSKIKNGDDEMFETDQYYQVLEDMKSELYDLRDSL